MALVGNGIGAPEWWGKNLDALWDVITGDLAERKPPYLIRLTGLRRQSVDVSSAVDKVQRAFDEARIEGGLAVAFEIV